MMFGIRHGRTFGIEQGMSNDEVDSGARSFDSVRLRRTPLRMTLGGVWGVDFGRDGVKLSIFRKWCEQ